MMQFNMYHHYTVDEHLLRCIGMLAEIETRQQPEYRARQRSDAQDSARQPRRCSTSRCSCTTSPKAASRTIRSPARGSRGGSARGSGFSAADTETVAWLVENHLVMSTVAQSRDLSDRKTIENFAAVVQSLERMKLSTILTTADIRAVGPGVWNGWKAQLLRTLYYETEPVLTGGFSEVNRAQRVAAAQSRIPRRSSTDWPPEELDRYIARLYPAYWLKVDLPHKLDPRAVRARRRGGRQVARHRRRLRHRARGVTELTVLAPDHPWLLVDHRRRLRHAPAPISSTRRSTPPPTGMALDTIAMSREFDRDEDEERRAKRDRRCRSRRRCAANCGCPTWSAKRAAPKGRIKAFAHRTRGHHQQPVVATATRWSRSPASTGRACSTRLTTTLSKLNLNIASAHVATFGERVVDVFYVTDLMGAQIASPTRQAADQARADRLVRGRRKQRQASERVTTKQRDARIPDCHCRSRLDGRSLCPTAD